LVLAADPARIAALVDMLKEKTVVDLAGARFVAPRIVGNLYVSNPRQILRDRGGELTLAALHMINVVLQPEIPLTDLLKERERLAGAREMEARNVVGIDRLDQQLDPCRIECLRGEPQVFGYGLFDPCTIDSGRGDADQAIELSALQDAGILDRLADAVLELALASRQAGDAALTVGPVAGRKVMQDLSEAVPGQRLGQGVLWIGIREEILDTAETGLGSCREAVHEIQLIEEHREIGGKLGHSFFSSLSGQSSNAIAVGASLKSLARSSNSVMLSISVPMEMLVARSRMISTTTGTRCSFIQACACLKASRILSGSVTRIALQPSPSATLT